LNVVTNSHYLESKHKISYFLSVHEITIYMHTNNEYDASYVKIIGMHTTGVLLYKNRDHRSINA
jgi:hypothetical protein